MITVETIVKAPLKKVWLYWTAPEHITQWNQASDDWHCPAATNDLRTGGTFSATMAAKDGSFSFEFGGVYNEVKEYDRIEYVMGDGRNVKVVFSGTDEETTITESFDPENQNPAELQQQGWQAILNNFKKYTEEN